MEIVDRHDGSLTPVRDPEAVGCRFTSSVMAEAAAEELERLGLAVEPLPPSQGWTRLSVRRKAGGSEWFLRSGSVGA